MPKEGSQGAGNRDFFSRSCTGWSGVSRLVLKHEGEDDGIEHTSQAEPDETLAPAEAVSDVAPQTT
ncbi:hypothetical protein SDC9_177260 [bioreactor metagenome]|uniref:Uncharacterized protein n=1 Tax=bioreactor metagenome TaxID=1076179 RepID=A0A645GSC2_9ZZZZ